MITDRVDSRVLAKPLEYFMDPLPGDRYCPGNNCQTLNRNSRFNLMVFLKNVTSDIIPF